MSRTRVLAGILVAGVALIATACQPAPSPGTSSSPSGAVDSVSSSGHSTRLQGWASDWNTRNPIQVVVWADGAWVPGVRTADVARADVDRAFGRGANFGFDVTIPGRPTTVCVVALNVGAGQNSVLGCTAPAGTPATTTPSTTTTSTTTTTTVPTPAIDQANESDAASLFQMDCTNDYVRAQTFTAGRTGALTRIDVWTEASVPQTIAMELRATVDGAPTGDVLATSVATGPSGAAWMTAAFNTPVVAGTTYAVVLRTAAPCSGPQRYLPVSGDTYDGGSMWSTSFRGSTLELLTSFDVRFRTWVIPGAD